MPKNMQIICPSFILWSHFAYSKLLIAPYLECSGVNLGNIATAQKVFAFGVILIRIQSECGEIRTRMTNNMDTFSKRN